MCPEFEEVSTQEQLELISHNSPPALALIIAKVVIKLVSSSWAIKQNKLERFFSFKPNLIYVRKTRDRFHKLSMTRNS
jgi:hypothetical protein